MLSEHSIAQSPRAQYGTIRVKVVRLLPKMYKFSARRADAAQAFMVRSSRITSTVGYSFPSLRRSVSAAALCSSALFLYSDSDSVFGFGLDCIGFRPQFAAARRNLQRCFELRAILVFGFWIRIRIGLYWITDAFAIHLLSFAIILLSSSVRRRKPALFHLDSLVLIPLWEAEIRLAHTSQSRIMSRPVTEAVGAL